MSINDFHGWKVETILRPRDMSAHTNGKASPSIQAASPLLWRLLITGFHLCTVGLLLLVLTPMYAGLYLTGLMGFMAVRKVRLSSRYPRAERLKFTRDGKYIVGISIGVGLAAINTGNNLLYLLLGMLLALIITSGVLSEISLKKLAIERSFPLHIFAKQPVLVAVTLKNKKRLIPSFSIQMNDLLNEVGRTKRCFFLKAAAQSQQTTGYRAEFSKRGQYVFDTVSLVTRFPFAFFVKKRRVKNQVSVLVYPAIHPFDNLPPALASRQGDQTSIRMGTGREFNALAEYKPGQNSRDIHWRRSAAADRLIVREYGDEVGITHSIYLNDILPVKARDEDEQERLSADIELCVEYACSLIMRAIDHQQGLTVITRQGVWPIQSDGTGLYPCLAALAVIDFLPFDSDNEAPSEHISSACYVVSLRETLHLAPEVPAEQTVTP